MTRLIFLAFIFLAACRQKEEPSDSIPAETKLVVQYDTLNYTLQACSASLEENSLKVYIERNPNSLSDYAVEIFQKDKEFRVSVKQPWGITDTSYVPARFKVVDKKLRLNKTNYKVGDTVHGEMKLLVLSHKQYFRNRGEMKLRDFKDTVRIIGEFISIVR